MPAAVAERLALWFVAERLALHEGGSATTHSTKINPVDITKTAIQLNRTGKPINTEAHRIERLPKVDYQHKEEMSRYRKTWTSTLYGRVGWECSWPTNLDDRDWVVLAWTPEYLARLSATMLADVN